MAKHQKLARQVGNSACSPAYSTTDSDNANNVPKGTTINFGSWVCTVNGSGGYTSHLTTPEEPRIPTDRQLVDAHAKLSEKPSTRVLLVHDSESAGNVPAPTLGKYVAYLKSLKRPRVTNPELLDGVDRVSRSIEGSIKLAESALGQTKTDQNQRTRTHNTIRRVTYSLGLIKSIPRLSIALT